MLDAYIIEQIRERQRNVPEERPFLELPIPQPISNKPVEEKTEPKRVIIIDTVDTDPEDEFVLDI